MSTTQPKIPHRPPRTPDRKLGNRPPRTTPKAWHTVINPQQHQLNNHHLHHPHEAADNRSQGTGASASDSHATPTSVVLRGGPPLTRDLSDLSGSYMGGNTMNYRGRTPSPSGVPVHVYPSDQSDTSYQRPWRHAHVLSSRGPMHPQPQCEENMQPKNQLDLVRKSRVMVGPQGLVEVVAFRGDDSIAADSIDSVLDGSLPGRGGNKQRFPLLVLLMDPHRKIYEFEQLWIDVETDTVRDVLHAVQLSLSDRWRQDYDGLFQVRNQTFNQLIHILNVEKYGVQPLEVWVAKPWAMSAKATIQYANSLLQHLSHLDVLAYHTSKDYPHTKKYCPDGASHVTVKDTEAILTFSQDAASRMYVPGGAILKHHHAHQFLSFAPPYEPIGKVEVLTAAHSITSSDDLASMVSDLQNLSMSSSFGDSCDERRAASPLSRTPENSVLDLEVSNINEVTSQKSSEAQQPRQPVIQRPKPIPPVTPVVPQMTTSARPVTSSSRRKEQAKTDEPRRSRLSMLLCCRNAEEEQELERHRNEGIRRNPTLDTLPEWKPYWEDNGSEASAISDSRPLLLSGEMHIMGRKNSNHTRSDWC